jgi:hypothetical protein
MTQCLLTIRPTCRTNARPKIGYSNPALQS